MSGSGNENLGYWDIAVLTWGLGRGAVALPSRLITF
jgi:hypothetical protein